MGQTKIVLSPEEQELVINGSWILTKNAVIEKVYALFGGLSKQFSVMMQKDAVLTTDAGTRSPKISKGEQYEGLPWVMLDQPRNFIGDDAFAIRSFFWWGNYCSITLQLAGKYQQQYAPTVQRYLQAHPGEWFIGTGTDPWKHHFRKDNYMPIREWEGNMSAIPFLKIAQRISLHEWNKLDTFFEIRYAEIMAMLQGKDQAPSL